MSCTYANGILSKINEGLYLTEDELIALYYSSKIIDEYIIKDSEGHVWLKTIIQVGSKTYLLTFEKINTGVEKHIFPTQILIEVKKSSRK